MKALTPFAAGIGTGLLLAAITYLCMMQFTDLPLGFIFTGARQ